MRLRLLPLVLGLLLAAVPAAHGATWRQVTAPGGASIDQVGALRTADGVLHVAWHRRTGPLTEDLLHTRIEPDGRVGATTPIVTGWTGVLDAALVAAPGGIRAFWGGQRSTNTDDPNQELNTALSADGGATWALQEGSIVPGGAQPHGSDVAATTLANGTTLQAWAGTLGTWVHAGLSPATPNHDYMGAIGQYGYLPGIASAGDAAVMAWYSSAAGRLGVLAQQVAPDGSPVGAPVTMPGSQALTAGGMTGRTPIVARVGGGFHVAYAIGNDVRWWRVGAPGAGRIARAQAPAATVAAAPDGRVWVAWSTGPFGRKRVFARRSNRAATVFGAAVPAGAVRNATTVYSLDAAATAGALDILALFGVGTTSGGSTSVARVLPGLSLAASRSSLGRRPRQVVFRVLDAGDPVAGATVRVSGRSARTNQAGRVTFTLRGRARAVATASGYTRAVKRLR